jgi:hypothetical protein
MAALSQADRTAVGAAFQTDASAVREVFGAFTKADVHAAIAAIDDWAVANAASFNAALPVAFRNGTTAAQKARAFMYVLRKRYEVGA